MNTFLRADLNGTSLNPASKNRTPVKALATSLLLLVLMLCSRSVFAGSGFGSATLTATVSVCSGNSATITLTGLTGCSTTPGDWTANYTVDSSPTGASSPWLPISGPTMTGSISATSPTVTITTPILTASAGAYTFYYHIRITDITNNCATGVTTNTTAMCAITVLPAPTAITGTNPICYAVPAAPGSATFSDGVPGGTWSSSATTIATINPTTGSVTGLTNGTTTITYTLSSGCRATYTATVSRAATFTAGGTVGCLNATNTLSSLPGGGPWVSSNPAVASFGTIYGALHSNSVGTTTITYTSPGGCVATETFTVVPLPAAITAPATVCAGQPVTLTNSVSGGTWQVATAGGGAIGTTTGIWTPPAVSSATNVVILYDVTMGTANCYASDTITVNPVPAAIANNAPLCVGKTIALATSSTGGTWSSSDGTVAAVGTGGAVTGVGAGTAIVSYTFPTGCASTVIVTVNPLPAAISGAAQLCVGQSITMTDATASGGWSVSPTTFANIGGTTGALLGIAAGVPSVTYTISSTGCMITTPVTVNALPAAISGGTSTCIGTTITLTDATPSGTWSSSNTSVATVGTAGDITGIISGTTTVSYILPTGCYQTMTFSVNPLPSAIGGTLSVCSASTTTLTNTAGSGTWSISPTTVATIGPGNGVVTGAIPGTATVTYTIGTGCSTYTIVTVNPIPAAITGTPTVCIGGTTPLADFTPGGVWSSANTTVGTVNTGGVVNGLASGTTDISYTLSATGCANYKTVTVNALPPAISGASSVCFGLSTTLTDASAGGTWSSSNTGIATIGASDGGVLGIASGTATITYTATSGCYTVMTFTVNGIPSNITGTSSTCIGTNTTLSNSVPGGTWSSANTGVAIAGATTGIITGIGAGTATISYSLSSSCVATTVVTVLPLPAAIGGSLSVCTGATGTLTDSDAGGTWSSASPSIASINSGTGVVTGNGVGTAVISYTLSTGCIRTTVVTVNALPAAISGPTQVCVNSSITLTDAAGAGTWAVSPTALANINSATGILTGLANGTVSVTYTSGTSGCAITSVVSVNALPTSITGTPETCMGSTATLTGNPGGGTWSTASTSVATVNSASGVVSGISAGTAIITYTLPTGCAGTTIVTIDAAPAGITGTLALCSTFTTTLSDATPGGTWSVSPTSVATINPSTGVLLAAIPGTAIVTYVAPGSSCAAYAVVTVNAIPAAITGTPSVCVGSTTTLSDFTTGGTWSSINPTIATVDASSGAVFGVSAGTATISYIVSSTGCGNLRVVTVNPTPPAITGPGYVCLGGTVTLSDASVGGTWSSNNLAVATIGANNGGVMSLSVGTVNFTYTSTAGCTTAFLFAVLPVPGPITGTFTLCQGSTTTLGNSVAGGTWSISPSAVATINTTTGVVSGIAAGTATATYTLGGTCSVYQAITVNPLPASIAGPTELCIGATITLTDATTGGTWSSSNLPVASIDPLGVVSGNSAGTTSITYTLPTGCIATTTVTVDPLPGPITGTLSLCVGATTTVSDASAAGGWTISPTSVATIDPTTGIITGITDGTATITYTFIGTGCTTTAVVTVNPLPSPISTVAGSFSICIGAPTTFIDADAGGIWTSSNTGVVTVGASSGIANGATAGTATITYTLPTGCMTTTTTTVSPLAHEIDGVAAICYLGTTTLTDDSTGGIWTSDNTFIGVIQPFTGVFTSVSVGTVNVTYTLPGGCYTSTVVTVNPIPPVPNGPTEVCAGSTITLTDTTTGGVWTSFNSSIASAGSASGIITGVSAGTTIITYTLPSTCYNTIVVTVDPVPNAISGANHICYGSSTTLTETTPGGTWSSSFNSIAYIDSITGVVTGTGLSGGTVYITYTLATGCYTTFLFTTNPPPAAISGAFVLCAGTTTTLSDPTPGGTWSAVPGTVAVVNPGTGVLFGVAGGTANVTYTLPTGCIATAVVTVNPQPQPISGPDSVCVGSTILLTDATPGGVWTSSNPGVATVGSTGIVTGMAAGVTSIIYTNPLTGCAISKAITVNPLPAAITGNNNVCIGLTLTLADGTHGGTWSSSNTSIASVTPIGTDSIVLHALDTGVVTITYKLSTGCYVTDPVTVNPLPAPIAGPFTVCVGSSVTMIDPTPGGTWMNAYDSVSNIDTFTGVLTGNSPGLDTITYTLSTGCITRTSITVNPLPSAIFGDNDVCVGLTTTLHDTTLGGTWSSSADTIAGVDHFTGVVTGISAGTSTISYTLPTGCTATIIYTVYPIPDVSIIDTHTVHPGWICYGGNYALQATGAGAGGTYTWSPAAGLSCTACASTVATPTITTTYIVTGTSAHGCVDTASITIRVDSMLAHIQVTGHDTICAGMCDTLIASGFTGSLFSWAPADGLSCTVCDTVLACSNVTHTYFATAIDSVGCSRTLPFTVTVMPLPLVKVDPNPAIVCRGSSTTLTASGAGTGAHYLWFPHAMLSCYDCASTVASDTMNLVYRVTGVSAFGCQDSIFVPVSVLDNTKFWASNDTFICKDQSVNLGVYSISNDGSRSDFHWYPEQTIDSPYNQFVVATPPVTTTYSVVITPNKCFSDTAFVTVAVEDYPQIVITPSTSVIAGTVVNLNASISNGVAIASYAWSPAEFLSCTECYHTTATPTVTTTYTFTATSNYGCSSSATTTVSLRCDNSQVFVPNTFTPNGDGVNDRFFVSGKGLQSILLFSVYNRWGELMFQQTNIQPNDPAYGWDGTYQGMVLPPDVFIYVVEAVCELGGEPYKFTGDISIVR